MARGTRRQRVNRAWHPRPAGITWRRPRLRSRLASHLQPRPRQATSGGAVQVNAVSGASAPPVARPISGSITSHRLAAVVPRMVADWMGAGLDVSRVGQFRTVTVIFILLEGMDPGSSEGVDVLQAAVVAAQSACADLQGSIYQILGDEKGISIVAAYGLPPMSHEDDAARAVRTGFRFQRAVGELGLTPSIGIATGRAFCCVYGARRSPPVRDGRAGDESRRKADAGAQRD